MLKKTNLTRSKPEGIKGTPSLTAMTKSGNTAQKLPKEIIY